MRGCGHPRLTHRTERGCTEDGLSDSRGGTGKGRLCRSPGRQDGAPGHEPPARPLRRARPRAAAAAMARARGGVSRRSRGPAQPPFWSWAREGRNPREDAALGASASPSRPEPGRLRSPPSRAARPCQPPLLFVTRLAGPAAGLREAGRMPCTPRR